MDSASTHSRLSDWDEEGNHIVHTSNKSRKNWRQMRRQASMGSLDTFAEDEHEDGSSEMYRRSSRNSVYESGEDDEYNATNSGVVASDDHLGLDEEANRRDERELTNETRKMRVIRCLIITGLLTATASLANVGLIVALNQEEKRLKLDFDGVSALLERTLLESLRTRVHVLDVVAESVSTSIAHEFETVAKTTSFSISPVLRTSEELIEWEENINARLSSNPTGATRDRIELPWYQAPPTRRRQLQSSERLSESTETFYARKVRDSMPITRTVNTTQNATTIYRVVNGEVEPIHRNSTSIWVPTMVNGHYFDQYSEQTRREALDVIVNTTVPPPFVLTDPFCNTSNGFDSIYESIPSPIVAVYMPTTTERETIATMEFTLESLWYDKTNDGEDAMFVVLESDCGHIFTFRVGGGSKVQFIGSGAASRPTAASLGAVKSILKLNFGLALDTIPYNLLEEWLRSDETIIEGIPSVSTCNLRTIYYPTQEFIDARLTNSPVLIQSAIGGIFVACVLSLIAYDCLVDKRQRLILDTAQKSSAIVRDLFPAVIRDRLYREAERQIETEEKQQNQRKSLLQTPKVRLQQFLDNGDGAENERAIVPTNRHKPNVGTGDLFGINSATAPIADLFPNCSVMFADLAGFTAWSSEREPTQVFTLLETIYGSIDSVAARLRVFKVETIGDCYVAATGLPDPREDHAVAMARFSHIILRNVSSRTKLMETALGPGTADLCMRIGIHSGPVTAGVLRGEKSRFQLFGDTMNTAARMESTGIKGRIQLSEDTADLLLAAGKDYWMIPRKNTVDVKGKGEMRTFWLSQKHDGDDSFPALGIKDRSSMGAPSSVMMASSTADISAPEVEEAEDWDEESVDVMEIERRDRLVEWNVQLMASLLEKMMAYHGNYDIAQGNHQRCEEMLQNFSTDIFDEVLDVMEMPAFNANRMRNTQSNTIHEKLPEIVMSELRDYIAQIAEMYRRNPFHNFEHASHVALSANKLIKRIILPDGMGAGKNATSLAYDVHRHTYGISSDPTTHFAVVFSALIHDAGHTGVPNGQLAEEHPEIAKRYKHKSVAEQRSVDIAWELLSAPCYRNLRACMFPSVSGLLHFRQLVVNSVLATDIFDKELGALRKARWAKAFGSSFDGPDKMMFDRKATIVIEHIIQASDVAHTMQHWHVYIKWNEKLFREMRAAFKAGRGTKDPAEGWYDGELWFFDNYVIPLAKKLKECGVFGVSSAEYYNYAIENRAEWCRKGELIVRGLAMEDENEEAFPSWRTLTS